MESIFLQYLELWRPLGYVLMFVGVFLEGHIALVVVGFLVARGSLAPIEAFIGLLISAIVIDNFWFWFGGKIDKHGTGKAWYGYVERAIGRFDTVLRRAPGRSLLYAKFIFGTYRASLIRIGMLHIDRRKFLKYNFAATSAWILIWGGISYAIGKYFLHLREYMRYIEVGMALGVGLVILLEWGVSKLLANRLKSNSEPQGEGFGK